MAPKPNSGIFPERLSFLIWKRKKIKTEIWEQYKKVNILLNKIKRTNVLLLANWKIGEMSVHQQKQEINKNRDISLGGQRISPEKKNKKIKIEIGLGEQRHTEVHWIIVWKS